MPELPALAAPAGEAMRRVVCPNCDRGFQVTVPTRSVICQRCGVGFATPAAEVGLAGTPDDDVDFADDADDDEDEP